MLANAMLAVTGQDSSGKLSLVYEPSPKHHPNVRGRVNTAPTNGQSAPDNSIQVKTTSPRRIGVDPATGEFGVFDQTREGVFHGHVRTWQELTQEIQNVLIDAGKVTAKGRIK